METVQHIIKQLEKLVEKDNEKTRDKIAQLCARLLNEEFYDYVLLNCAIQDAIDDLSVMEEIKGRKESKILHMDLNEIKEVLQKLKAAVE